MSVFESFRLDGKVAIITGGSAGLGKDMACALAEAGVISSSLPADYPEHRMQQNLSKMNISQ